MLAAACILGQRSLRTSTRKRDRAENPASCSARTPTRHPALGPGELAGTSVLRSPGSIRNFFDQYDDPENRLTPPWGLVERGCSREGTPHRHPNVPPR